MKSINKFNTRILVIDDEETIRDSFREILLPRKSGSRLLEEASAGLFDDDIPPIMKQRSDSIFDFELEEAANGQDGLATVQKALTENRPFAAIFVDMRMPGWDGLRTVQHIRKIDERAEIVFVTAYSDYSIDEVVDKAGSNVSYHCKPFSVEEIRQIATKAVYEWNKARNLEELIEIIAFIRAQRWQLDALLNNILHQVSEMVGSLSAMLAKRTVQNIYKKMVGIGKLANDEIARKYLSLLPDLIGREIYQSEDFAYFQVEKYGILALFETGGQALKNEHTYLVRLFLEHAVQAVTNLELQESLIRKEKLSAVGQAVGMIAHDLRGPIGNICQGIELSEEMAAANPGFVKDMNRLMQGEAKKALTMVNDILDFTRNSELVKSPVDIRPLLESVQKSAALFLEQFKIPLQIEMAAPFYFPSDASKMERILINLIKNAAESLHQSKTVSPRIILSMEKKHEGFWFRVTDNGPGIPEQMLDQLFVPFATHGKTGGTGLGLAIVKQFVEAHKGKISVDTGLKGTTFNVWLPDEM
ncbi:MAG: hypothetical protein BWK80_40115 [Desulfobacteraceae bacterium IS3]|nr:MAG: hypothetical protein BWK80_40115 [Desulfobacteraceae bacterium IS3]